MICAGENNVKDACVGDEGGPMAVIENDRQELFKFNCFYFFVC